ncbi:heparinase II/III family protein [Nitrosomonas oligotropha]|uniref:heparinase II/III family protein n=1 Tax=Nitrosomonas oligotropha TaxID=42354 RepID=UPI0019611037|nr:alginate lyase family protein [Nitrosomonas oligotropha]
MSNLAWKFNRLRTMGLPEIGYRVRQAIQTKTELFTVRLDRRPPSPDCSRVGNVWLDTLPRSMDSGLYCAAADRVLAGYYDVFALHNVQLGFPTQWNRDPKTGIEAPLVYGKTLDYRDERLVGDIKYLWESNRHLHLTTLAQAYHLSGDARYAEGVQSLLESWFDQCPYPFGVNWTSSLELAIRLVNWSFTWHLLGGEHSPLFISEGGQQFKRRWLDSIYQHSHFIAGYLSRHSSANNHLFGELMGLLVAAMTWPYWPESHRWQRQAYTELEAEALKQNAADGVNREQAIYYQHEVIDMMFICCIIGRANGIDFSRNFTARLERMLEFIASLMDVTGAVPMIGDADGALIVHWSKEHNWNVYRSQLATGAVLFNRPDFKVKAKCFDDKSCWLLGEDARQQFDSMVLNENPSALPREFRDGGYFILGSQLDTADEVRIVADAGPLGYLSIAAHGHADALSFTLSVAGHALLVDPGTYAFHTQRKWRDYFRGTSAHNTVRVDGVDQSESGGNFMWLRKANARCEGWESDQNRDCLIASHDGYARLPDPVVHRRKIEFLKNEGIIRVEDVLECAKEHTIELNWHFAEMCEVRIESGKVLATVANISMEMTMPDCDSQPELRCGEDEPPSGWVSRSFDEKVPAPTVTWREKITGTTRRLTILRILARYNT